MNKLLFILIFVAAAIWLSLTLVSNRLSEKIATTLRNDAVAVLGLAVEVDKVDFNLASGRANISGLQIANLPGFPSENVFDMVRVEVNISVLSLLPAVLGWLPYRIEQIAIESPVVSVDIDKKGRSNLQVILRQIQQSKQSAVEAEPESSDTMPDKEKRQQNTGKKETQIDTDKNQLARLKVDQLLIDNLTFKINRPDKAEKTGALPPINMQDIGGENGTTIAGLGLMVSTRLASDILRAVLIRKAKIRMNGSAENLFKKLEKKLQE